MIRVCICCKQRISKTSDISLFRFPRSAKLFKRWLFAIGAERKVTESSRICSRHFKKNDFRYDLVENKRYLKQGAIPSLRLNNKEIRYDPILDSQDTIVKENQPRNSVISYMETTEAETSDTTESPMEGDNPLSESRVSLTQESSNEQEKKNKRYLYDVRWEEISTSPVQAKIYWEVAIKKITRQKKIVKSLRQKAKRLEKQILELQTLVKKEAKKMML
ncbi:uncharacterized protein LOC105422281 isoform X1 [Pogonomyrmex barbatus]|uniref:Uncharacterized protein LOC105422281 isoform X1 n=1 Tax=Pogonomyrmex barbatus TaxID=144034 RepID=A0A6I9VVV9_9HYME|nr:uncharacterized protein LOC105422281 isoform X1 [Pogonomyrmex barbatus]